ncbi:MAG TPA: amino acid ABC transporter permease [Actinomycetota bacterium]|nr:amino acid ABC transporter permease [Actinomycetota bacterium]
MDYLFDPDNWRWVTSGNNLSFLLRGFLVNLEIAAIAMVLSLAVGLLLALGRVSRSPAIKVPVGAWIDVWRNVPLILLILYMFLALPQGAKDAWEAVVPDFFPEALRSGSVLAALLGLVLYNSAVIAEIFRAGIQSLERGQGEAAAALGMTHWKAMRLVILPQGLRRMVPATVSQLITLNKDTTLVSIIAIQEVMRHARIVSSFGFFGGVRAPVLQVFIVVGLMFIVVNLLLSRLSRRLEVRERRRTGTTVTPVTGLEDQVAAQAEAA